MTEGSARFDGKRAVVTGAARGLGQALSICLADLGADLVLLGRNPDGLERTRAAIAQRTGRAALTLPLDLCDRGGVEAACGAILAAGGTVDILVNNGASWLAGRIEDTTADQIFEAVNSAVTGSILMVRYLLPGLLRSPGADVVTLVSTAGLPNAPRRQASAAFHAAKHGQAGFSDLLRQELKDRGIRVTAVYPPDFDDVSPLSGDWFRPRDRARGERLSNKDVVDTILFALRRPRILSIDTIVLDNV